MLEEELSKKAKIQSLIWQARFVTPGEIWLGMEEIIDLIKETKDGEYIEIFKEDFLQYFAIPARKGEQWRWEAVYEVIPKFPNEGIFKYHVALMNIVSAFANIK